MVHEHKMYPYDTNLKSSNAKRTAQCKPAQETVTNVYRFEHVQVLGKCELNWIQEIHTLSQTMQEASAKCKPAQDTGTNVHRFGHVKAQRNKK